MEQWALFMGTEALGAILLPGLAVLLILQLVLLLKFRGLSRRYRQLLGSKGQSGQTLEEVLFHHLENVRLALERMAAMELDTKKLARKNRVCARRPGMVRFNAFPDTGGEMSFSVALLDEDFNGVVVTSMYGRNESFVYAKPVESGNSSYYLTEEEKEAIARVRSVNPGD